MEDLDNAQKQLMEKAIKDYKRMCLQSFQRHHDREGYPEDSPSCAASDHRHRGLGEIPRHVRPSHAPRHDQLVERLEELNAECHLLSDDD